MKSSSADWLFLRPALAIFVVSLVLSALLLGGSNYLRTQVKQRHNTEQQHLQQARSQFHQARLDQADLRGFLAHYQSLIAHGWIGQEQRLAWVEAIDTVQQRNHLFPVAYQITAQGPYALPGIAPQISVQASRMTFKLPLLHEDDLLRFLGGLKTHSQGFFILQGCRVQRNDPLPDAPHPAPLLNEECTLDWLTIHPK